jgi:hypothetical protein
MKRKPLKSARMDDKSDPNVLGSRREAPDRGPHESMWSEVQACKNREERRGKVRRNGREEMRSRCARLDVTTGKWKSTKIGVRSRRWKCIRIGVKKRRSGAQALG